MKKYFVLIILFGIFIKLTFASSTLTVTGYAIYLDGVPYSGEVKATIKETGDVVINSTTDGNFVLNFDNLNLTSGKIYTLVITVNNSVVEKEFMAD